MTSYYQCLIRRNNESGYTEQVSWIPACYAKINKVLKIKNNQIWEDGWVVYAVYKDCKLESLPNSHQVMKGHRKATGDALQK